MVYEFRFWVFCFGFSLFGIYSRRKVDFIVCFSIFGFSFDLFSEFYYLYTGVGGERGIAMEMRFSFFLVRG